MTGEKREIKTFWQFIKFLLVSGVVSLVQLILVNLLFYVMKEWKTQLPVFLRAVFSPSAIGEGNDNWGYVLPFFLSNLIANIYGYIQNKKTTFKSDASALCFVIYFAVMVMLILFSTWLQGFVANVCLTSQCLLICKLAPTIAACSAGFVQMVILFPLEKFVLLKEKKNNSD